MERLTVVWTEKVKRRCVAGKGRIDGAAQEAGP